MAENILEMFFENVVPWILILLFGALSLFIFVGIPLFIYSYVQESKSPTFELKKNEWVCMDSKDVQSTMYIHSGQVLVPITTTDKECVKYERNHR